MMVPAGTVFAQTVEEPKPAAEAQDPAAQDPDAQDAEAEPEESTVESVTVTGRQNDIRTSIDSMSYSVGQDLQTTSGSLADALRNIPSVEVDPDGNISLRGDAGVTILVDGRPSALFSGNNRGQVVLQVPADQFARIEVMTNPSAAYRPDGSGGVINLISKPTATRQGSTMSGSIRGNIGNDGRWNVGGNLAWSKDKLTLTGDVGVRHDAFRMETSRLREFWDAGTSQWLEARNGQLIEGESDSAFARLAAEYRLSDKTMFSGDLTFSDFSNDAYEIDTYEADNALGGVGYAYRRRSNGGFNGQHGGLTARVIRTFEGEGHDWSNEVRVNSGDFEYAADTLADQLIPVSPSFYERVDNDTSNLTYAFTSAYKRSIGETGKLRLGYEFEGTDLDLDNSVLRGPALASLTPDPLVSNQFAVDQQVHAVYGTWEQAYGKLTAQYGLRLEQANVDIDQITIGTKVSNDYFRAYPTLHLGYELDENQTLRASYSRRIQRPQPQDLNPFLSYQDPLNYRSGNPNLEPQETDSYELTWQRRVEQTFYQATLYYRDTTDAFTQVTSDLGGGIFVTRPENLGARTATGVELVANGALHPKLRYQASLNWFRQEIDASNIVGGVDSEGTTLGGRLTVNWSPTDKDFVQVSGIWTGEQLQAQGVREPTTLVNMGYRHKLTDKLSMNITVRDVFDDFGDVNTLDTALFRERSERKFGGRVAFIGLTWNFGGGQRRPEQFDFTAPQTGQ